MYPSVCSVSHKMLLHNIHKYSQEELKHNELAYNFYRGYSKTTTRTSSIRCDVDLPPGKIFLSVTTLGTALGRQVSPRHAQRCRLLGRGIQGMRSPVSPRHLSKACHPSGRCINRAVPLLCAQGAPDRRDFLGQAH